MRHISGLLVLLAAPVVAQESPLRDVGFLQGCWVGRFEHQAGPGTMEEFYTTSSENVMLGTTRYLVGQRVVDFELTIIFADTAGVWLRPYPRGRRSEHDFALTRTDEREAVFEAPEHDYPKRIIYRSNPDGSRTARIDSGAADREGREWHLMPTACPTNEF